jgi:hypothetical protein
MCGGNQLIKQEDYFVCQNCGTKYSPEDAKKLFIEGVVKIDNTERVDKWLELGRRAIEGEDYQSAEKYYTSILEEDTQNWEAFFYSLYSRAMQCKIGEIGITAELFKNNLDTFFSLLKKQEGDNYLPALITTSRIRLLTSMLWHAANSHYIENITVEGVSDDYVSWVISIVNLEYKTGDLIERYYPQHIPDMAVNFWKSGNIISNIRRINRQTIDYYTKKIRKYDPAYFPPEPPQPPTPPVSQKSGCFIATSVYGSYDCPPVWTLRRYRDETLQLTFFGKAFIKIYYLLSPALVRKFGQTNWFKMVFQKMLDKLVTYLEAKGVQNTSYVD